MCFEDRQLYIWPKGEHQNYWVLPYWSVRYINFKKRNANAKHLHFMAFATVLTKNNDKNLLPS